MACYEIRDLTFTYPGETAPALREVTLTVADGEFLVLCGASGSGKSTLLRQLKSVLAPHGARSGEIIFGGVPLEEVARGEQAGAIGFVLQDPENQVVTDKVWHELAFGLESLGYETPVIRRRVAEMAAFFGIQDWFYKNVSELSGGQKQLLSLASVMVMQPRVLLLDEPTSQLDPIAAADFLAVLGRINRELGTTVILSEHRLEEALSYANRAAVLEDGRLLCCAAPGEVGALLRRQGSGMFYAMPAAMRIWGATDSEGTSPVTVCEGRAWLHEYAASHPLGKIPPERVRAQTEPVLTAREVWFAYEQDAPEVLRGLTMTVCRGEHYALLGANGAGKSTTLRVLAGLLKPLRGEVTVCGRVGLLPQDPQTLFVKKTVREDLMDVCRDEESLARAVALCRLDGLLDRHPYDLSGGEQQRAALAKLLLCAPNILLLDEPTKGLDAAFKRQLAQILRELQAGGVTIVTVSHDVEFCAEFADRCALFFDGGITAEGTPRAFFSGNCFYTTAADRIARELLPGAVTVRDVAAACGAPLPEDDALPNDVPPLPQPPQERMVQKLPLWRKILGAVSGAAALGLTVQALRVSDLSELISENGLTRPAGKQLILYAILIAAIFVCALCFSRGGETRAAQPVLKKQRLSVRTRVCAGLILLLIPLTLYFGIRLLGVTNYYLISLLVLLEAMIPFFLVFEGRRPQPRELVLIAVLCALNVAGRAALFMLPEFKPVVALTILAGVAFGGETGFLVGALSMLASNVLFSQGPWTPFQMFAMGLIGFLAGVLARCGVLRRSRLSLCLFGVIASVVIYGGIMNPASALIWARTLDWKLLLSYYLTGLPVDLIRAAATWLFLWFAGLPVLEKFDRVKLKYGLLE